MIPPTELTAAKAWSRMGEEHREFWSERAGVLEYEGGLSRDAADRVLWELDPEFARELESAE